MTLRTKTLSAVAALTISAGGFAFAQDSTTAPAPQPDQAQPAPETTTPPAATPPAATTEAPAAEAPAAEAEAPAADAPAADAPATDAPAAEAPATEAPAAEAPAEEAPAAEPAAPAADAPSEAEPEAPAADAPATAELATEAPAEADQASESATEAELEEQPTPEPTEEAVDMTPAEQDTPADETAETGTEAVEAEAPTEAVDSPAADAEAAAEGEAAEHEEAGGSHGGGHIEDISFSFEGPFGRFDQFQLQRGLQVYTEVCAACHGLRYVPIRTLSDDGGPGLPEDQVRAYAANLTPILDAETGEERPRLPTDHFPTIPHADGMGPDLSLMAKARAGFHGPYGFGINQLVRGIGGPEYIHAILTSYTGDEVEQAGSVFYVNDAYSTGQIAMPPPLSDGLVTYEDGTEATVDQMSTDVAAFLMWTAEPKLMARKQVGFAAVLLLMVLTGLLYFTNKRLWAPHKGKLPHK